MVGDEAEAPSPLRYYLGKTVSLVYRILLAALHFAAWYLILAETVVAPAPLYLTAAAVFWAVYGLAALVSVVVPIETASLVAVVIALVAPVFGGYVRNMKPLVKKAGYAWWTNEAFFTFATEAYDDLCVPLSSRRRARALSTSSRWVRVARIVRRALALPSAPSLPASLAQVLHRQDGRRVGLRARPHGARPRRRRAHRRRVPRARVRLPRRPQPREAELGPFPTRARARAIFAFGLGRIPRLHSPLQSSPKSAQRTCPAYWTGLCVVGRSRNGGAASCQSSEPRSSSASICAWNASGAWDWSRICACAPEKSLNSFSTAT